MTSDARRRIDQLLDPDSFWELPPLGEVAYVAGRGRVGGRPVYVSAASTEPSSVPPLEGMVHKQVAFFEAVDRDPAPLVLLLDTPDFVQQAQGKTPLPPDADLLLASDQGVGRQFSLQARLGGRVPQAAVLLGQLGATLAFPVALADVAVMVEGSAVCLGRPDAVRLMTGQTTDFDHLGGARMHCTVSGVGHALAPNEGAALDWVRAWLGHLPLRAGEACPEFVAVPPDRDLAAVVERLPADQNQPFPIRDLIEALVDGGSVVEIKERFATSCFTGLARVDGRTLGILASDSSQIGGILFPETCHKMIDFIRFCDTFGIPLAFLADTPGFMVGEATEQAGAVRAGADLLATIARVHTPHVCLAVRRAYTAGLYAMAGPGFDPVAFWASPLASISLFGRKALELFGQERELSEQGQAQVDEVVQESEHPELMAAKGLVDAVLPWPELRPRLAAFVHEASVGRSRRSA